MRHQYRLTILALTLACAPASLRTDEDQAARSVRVSREASLSAVTTQFEITEYRDRQVEGRFWATSGAANRSFLERRYECAARRAATDRHTWVCTPDPIRVDWSAVLAALDGAGVLRPPPDDTPPSMLCADGAPWRVVVHRYLVGDSITTVKGCLPVGEARITFQRRVDSVITSVEDRMARGR